MTRANDKIPFSLNVDLLSSYARAVLGITRQAWALVPLKSPIFENRRRFGGWETRHIISPYVLLRPSAMSLFGHLEISSGSIESTLSVVAAACSPK